MSSLFWIWFSPTFYWWLGWLNAPPRSHILCELPENTFCSIVQVTNKDVNTSTDPLGTSLVTSCRVDFAPLIPAVWAQQPSQVSIHYILTYQRYSYLSKLLIGLINLAQGILRETISKTFLKAKGTTPRALQKPTKLVRSSQKNSQVG